MTMKIILAKQFYTARVFEGLSSLTDYVREASRIADEIKPILSYDSPGQKDPDAVPPAPKLNDVKVSSGPSKWPPHTLPPPNLVFWVTVSGQNLENIHSFALIPAHDLSYGGYSTTAFFDQKGVNLHNLHPLPQHLTSVFAGFTQQVPPGTSGKKKHYHAWIQDSFGQEDLLFNALPNP
jgi:hypothetical protein